MIRFVTELSEAYDAEIREYEQIHGAGSWAKRTVSLPKLPQGEMLKLIERKLDEFSRLTAGWDGYAAPPASKDSLRDTKLFLKMRPHGAPLPHPQIDTSGFVNLQWYHEDVHADLVLEGDGTYYYFATHKDADGTERELTGEDQISSGWPRELVCVLERNE